MERLRDERDFSRFLAVNRGAFVDGDVAKYLDYLLKKYRMDKNTAIARADIERGYGYQILRGRRSASREKLIRLAFAMGLTVEDAQRLLATAQKGALYPKNKRDACLIFCLSHGLSLMEASAFLYDLGMEPIE